ncbi:MAG: hypothetical protein D6753_00505 [Planctomycetota bacterium]|nr:MAG: hypothetical protein D6753_00505 [Planctomycetota bacterium]
MTQRWQSVGRWALFSGMALGLFVLAWLVGHVVRSRGTQIERGPQAPWSSAEPASLAVLPDEAARAGIRLVPAPEPHALMFVHPDSPCWVEVPRPDAFPDYATAVRARRAGQFGGLKSASAPAEAQAGQRGRAVSEPDAGAGFLGAQACTPCHRERYERYRQTAHFLTSARADTSTVLGPLEDGNNMMHTGHPDLKFRMLGDGAGRVVQEVTFRELRKRVPMDIVTGAGVVGQTYLFWQGHALYQDHVSYFTRTGSWINSPGYQDGTAWYARKVIPKCLECHATYVATVDRDVPVYDPATLILGISCERCHGPGAEHVAYHEQHPDAPARHVVNPSDLTAEQQNDVCAQCHFGSATPIGQPFSFRPGDDADAFWQLPPGVESLAGGVHSSNQLARLQLSACFVGSPAMTCSDCHDPHENQRGDLGGFSQRCQACHQPEHCGMFERIGLDIATNCIDCHMPRREDDKIAVHQPAGIEFPMLRDHFIRVVPELSERLAP